MSGDFSIGAVGASLVAGIVSFLGLVISKEQKTSEFRQSWIDAMRAEMTAYLTNFNAIVDALSVKYGSQEEKVEALSKIYSKFNEASFAITLRINPKERTSKEVISCMKRFSEISGNENEMTSNNIRPIEKDFLLSSQKLLKLEWRRVKRGEFTFFVTKILSISIVILLVIYLILEKIFHYKLY